MESKKPNNPRTQEFDGVYASDAYKSSNDAFTLRDYFAAKAMQAIVAGDGARMVADRDERYDEANWAEVVAKNTYEFADAMLKQREL